MCLRKIENINNKKVYKKLEQAFKIYFILFML